VLQEIWARRCAETVHAAHHPARWFVAFCAFA